MFLFQFRLKITMYVPLLVSSGLGIIGILFSWAIARFEVVSINNLINRSDNMDSSSPLSV